jgi:hypothetical protein
VEGVGVEGVGLVVSTVVVKGMGVVVVGEIIFEESIGSVGKQKFYNIESNHKKLSYFY